MINRSHKPIEITALTYNVRLFGDTARYRRSPNGPLLNTPFYFHDHNRLPELIKMIRQMSPRPTFLGFTEVWDTEMQKTLMSSLSDIYPHAITSPAARGLGGVLSDAFQASPSWANRLFGNHDELRELIQKRTRKHYESELGQGVPSGLLAGAIKTFLQEMNAEDWIGRSLSSVSKLLMSGPIWGAGLLFFSQLPIYSSNMSGPKNSNFVPHPEKADWERLANKGAVWTTIRVNSQKDVRVCLKHDQEGPTSAAIRARKLQNMAVCEEAEAVDMPVIVMGDMNVEDNTDEEASMIREFEKSELFEEKTGPTYINPNVYQAELTGLPIKAFRPSQHRLDRIFTRGLKRLYVRTLRDEFLAHHRQFHLADHDPVLGAYLL